MLESLVADIQFLLSRHGLRLEEPAGLALLLAVPVLAVIGMWMGEDLRWYRRVLVQVLRAGLVLALALAVARPVRVKTDRAPAVVLLADLSDSLDTAARERSEELVRTLWDSRGDAKTFLVGFGRWPQLLAGPEQRRVALAQARVPGSDGSDLAAALRFSYGLFPDGFDRRVLLVSDGEQTRGDLAAEAERARECGIEVSAALVRPLAAADARMEGLVVPASAREGETLEVTAAVTSSNRRGVSLWLLLDGRVQERRRVLLQPGANRETFSVSPRGLGWHAIEVRLLGTGDRYPQNNKAAARVFLVGRPRVLLVQQRDEPNPLRSLLESQAGTNWEVQVCTPESMPAEAGELAELDLVFLDDLVLAKLPPPAQERLRAYVEENGGGLIVTVGSAGAELAGPQDIPLEAVLPVAFRQVKKKEQIPAALSFVMDRSSSMGRGSKFVILLRAVADTLDRLPDTTQVSMVMFDDFPEVVVPLTEAEKRKSIRAVLLNQRMGGGTSIYPALEEAHRQLKKSAARLKHVILLSDGQSMSLYGHYGYIVEKMAADGITISAVALGDDADQDELRRIAARAGGRYYFTNSMQNVPKIFTAETENITESNTVEQTIRAVPAKIVQAFSGIDFSSAPPLRGYVASEAQPTSEALLVSSDRSEPLLARWRFGLGRVLVDTSDAQGAWSGDWVDWPGFAVLWPRLIDDTLRRTPPGDLRLVTRLEDDRGVALVRVGAERPGEAGEVPTLTLLDARGQSQLLPLVRRGLGLYRAEWQADDPAALVAERLTRKGVRERAFGYLGATWREEYLSATPNPSLLAEVARRTGGKVDPKPEELLGPGRQERRRTEPLWPPFVLAAMGLFLAEVLVRRL